MGLGDVAADLRVGGPEDLSISPDAKPTVY
jgi:hypothetical protein